MQQGLFFDWPQRHREKRSCDAASDQATALRPTPPSTWGAIACNVDRRRAWRLRPDDLEDALRIGAVGHGQGFPPLRNTTRAQQTAIQLESFQDQRSQAGRLGRVIRTGRVRQLAACFCDGMLCNPPICSVRCKLAHANGKLHGFRPSDSCPSCTKQPEAAKHCSERQLAAA